MSTTKIIYPGYFRVVEYTAGEWRFRNGNLFYKAEIGFMNTDNREAFYGTTMAKVVIELFRLNGGKAGYYAPPFEGQEILLLWFGLAECENHFATSGDRS